MTGKKDKVTYQLNWYLLMAFDIYRQRDTRDTEGGCPWVAAG